MPVQAWKFTLCMPTGRFIWAMSPARKGEWKKKENEKMRDEEARAAGLQNVLNKYTITHPKPLAVPVMPEQL
jgi:hypothetical protein